jgi:UTP--glucose-1-phosphate uridylyltransferase
MIEKPKIEDATTDIAILGRYITTPEIFDCIKNTPPGAGNEIQLTDALRALSKSQVMYAYDYVGKRYDIGSRLGYLMATVEHALRRDDLNADFKNYLRALDF